MHAVLNSALPIFALILTGFICGYFFVFDKTATDNLNRFAVYLALPSLMFVAMSKITPDQVRQFGFLGAFCGGSSITFAVAFAISRIRGRRVANASIEGLDAGYSNVGFMGIPMCLLVFGPESAPASIIATLFTACILFLFAVVVVEIDLQKGKSIWSTGTKVAKALLTSPLLIAPVAGLCIGLSSIKPGAFREFHHAAWRGRFAGRAGLHRALSCAGKRGEPRRSVHRQTRGDETDFAACRHGVPRLLRLHDATALVAFGRDLERPSDRIGAVHHRQALWSRSRRDIGLHSRLACLWRCHRLAAGGVARMKLVQKSIVSTNRSRSDESLS
jgi:auxin efflux family transporter